MSQNPLGPTIQKDDKKAKRYIGLFFGDRLSGHHRTG